MSEVAQTVVVQQEHEINMKSLKEKQLYMMNALGRVLNAVTLRHRLIEAAWESEVLAKVKCFFVCKKCVIRRKKPKLHELSVC